MCACNCNSATLQRHIDRTRGRNKPRHSKRSMMILCGQTVKVTGTTSSYIIYLINETYCTITPSLLLLASWFCIWYVVMSDDVSVHNTPFSVC